MRLTKVETLTGAPVGEFLLPYQPGEPDRVCQLLQPPIERNLGNGFEFYWFELADDHSRTWNPQTPEEMAAALAFFEAAREAVDKYPSLEELGPLRKRSVAELDLLEAIRADPDADAPRLIYADWLQDRGDPLGEYIALHVNEEAGHLCDEDDEEAASRRFELLDLHARDWLAPLLATVLFPETYHSGGLSHYFVRGFFEHLRLDRPHLLPDHAEVVRAAAPLLRRLSFLHRDLDIPGVLSDPIVEQIEILHFLPPTHLTDEDISALAKAHLRSLTDFKVQHIDLSLAAAQALADSPNLDRLQKLFLSVEFAMPGAVTTLLGSPRLKNLEELQSHLAILEPEEAAAVATILATAMPRLRTLALVFGSLTPESLLPLAQPGALPQLEHFRLYCWNPEHIRSITAAPWLKQLKSLYLIFDPAAEVVPFIAELVSPPLEEIRLTIDSPAAIEAIAAAPGLSQLKKLELQHPVFSADDLALLGNSPNLRNLSRFALMEGQLDRDAVMAMIKGPNFQTLETFALGYQSTDSEGETLLREHFGSVYFQAPRPGTY